MHPSPRILAVWALVSAFLVGTVPASAASLASEALRDPGRLLLKSADFRTSRGAPAAGASLSLGESDLAGVRYWIVQVREPVGPQTRRALAAQGAQILRYVPNAAFLVRAPHDVAVALRAESSVRWVGAYRPDFKLDPDIGRRAFADPRRPVREGERLLLVCAFPGEDLDGLAAAAGQLGADLLGIQRNPRTPRLLVRVPTGGEVALARLEGVEWIEEPGELTHRNDTTRWVAQSNQNLSTPIWDQGLHGENQVIGHVDGPLPIDSCFFVDSVDNTPGPTHRKVIAYRGALGQHTHGAHTAATAAGLREDGSLLQAGLAYEAKITHTRDDLVSGYLDTASNFYDYLQDAHGDGARVHTNSWGDDTRTAYTTWCVDIDAFSHDQEEDLVLFAVTNTSTLKTPENAKNCLAVGASQQSPNQESHGSGGRGPTADGRRKPEIYLPGISIQSANTATCATVALSGTSMACPAVAACAVLTRQYFQEGFYPTGVAAPTDALAPSGALMKATLLNASDDMANIAGYPSNREGWGRLLLDDALFFAGDARAMIVRDVRNASGLSTGEVDEYEIDVQSGLSFRVTMAFTDVPAAHAAAIASVNDLDLEVTGPNGTYLGNVFASDWSALGGLPDNLNNVERVVLPAGGFTAGTWTVRVRANSVPDGPQGYALHVSGDVEEQIAVGTPLREPTANREFRLAQNLPNPFTGNTQIGFALPRPLEISLGVFDISGRHIRTLSEGTLPAGEYTVSWDGRDESGEEVASGIYFYRLEGDGLEETRKMVVLH